MAEETLHAGVVQAGRLSRHALREPHLLQSPLIGELPALPALVGMQQRGAVQAPLQVIEHLHGLGEVRAPRHRPRHDLDVAEVDHGGQARLGSRHLELGDVGRELLQRPVGPEVAIQDVAGNLSPLASAGVVALAADAAAEILLAHDLEHGLSADGQPPLGPQGHGHLTASHAVGGAGEYLAHERAHAGPPVGLRVSSARVAIVGAFGKPELVEHEPERVVMPQRVCRSCSIPSAKALSRFKISFSSSSSRTRASSSSSREKNAGSSFLGLPLGLGSSASGPPSR